MIWKVSLFKRQVSLGWTMNKFSLIIIKIPDMPTYGITSRCSDLKHVLFLDYDFIERWIVEEELQILQDKYKLTPFYLFTTSEEDSKVSNCKTGNYHAICLTKMPIKRIVEIQEGTHCDFRYKKMFMLSRYKSWVLRIKGKGNRPKPKYLGLIGSSVHLNNDVSTPHLTLLRGDYNVDYIPYRNKDKLTETYITTYTTGKQ